MVRHRLGDMLVANGIITKDELFQALDEQKKTKQRLGKVLVDLGIVSEEVIIQFLSSQMGITYVKLSDMKIEDFKTELQEKIIIAIANKHMAIPIAKENDILIVAMADPLDIFAIDDIKRITGYNIKPVIASESEIKMVIEHIADKNILTVADIIKGMDLQKKEEKVAEERVSISELKSMVGEAPMIQLVNHIISTAIYEKASDIHIEIYATEMRVRYRIDGILHEVPSPPKSVYAAFVSRIKILARLDIAERRLPQDGRAKVKFGEKEIDLRISIIPTNFGEKVVIRILDPATLCIGLKELGFEDADLEIYDRLIHRPYGIILVTGPTGSGKSTTLYSTLQVLNLPDKNIVTIEDPIEYLLYGINQVQVKPEIGLDFPSGLRSFVRQDPDIILVGEIRDKETAEVAINAALTGHLVLSTLHTNDAVGAITRLVNMGIEPFLIGSTLILSVAQRLVRRICQKCIVPFESSTTLLKSIGIISPIDDKPVTLYKGTGCKHCNQTGYKGRIGTFELMEVTEEIRDMIFERESTVTIKNVACKGSMKSLSESARKKVLSGITTIEEMLRVTFEGR